MKNQSDLKTPHGVPGRYCARTAFLAVAVFSASIAVHAKDLSSTTPAAVSATASTTTDAIPDTGLLPDLATLLQAVRTTNSESSAALKSSNVDTFALAARLAPDYHEVTADGGRSISRDGVVQRERTLLAGHRYTDIETGITSMTLSGTNTATVTLWRRVTYVSIGTPPTLIKTPQGTRIINNTARFTRTQLLEQMWQRSSGTWLVSRCRVARDSSMGVL